MKVNDSNLGGLVSTQTNGTQAAQQTGQIARGSVQTSGAGSSDDVHLSELVRSLRSLAADSPERQARLEQIARAYANGSYQVDAQATAAKIIDDAQHP
ncbi:MAG TPA: flagellar biosynthesis anti-sigma factor FlgM [Bryobacteraceae bacterium]|jgi:flagellar biosynthesis anti-sigma factor FlgM|nr:flagellar biosynthesis anti-sigma factor FlgM [Bryobacteraceae bacterium]